MGVVVVEFAIIVGLGVTDEALDGVGVGLLVSWADEVPTAGVADGEAGDEVEIVINLVYVLLFWPAGGAALG